MPRESRDYRHTTQAAASPGELVLERGRVRGRAGLPSEACSASQALPLESARKRRNQAHRKLPLATEPAAHALHRDGSKMKSCLHPRHGVRRLRAPRQAPQQKLAQGQF